MKRRYKNMRLISIVGLIAYVASILIFLIGSLGLIASGKINNNSNTIVEYKEWKAEVIEFKSSFREIYNSSIGVILSIQRVQ